MHAFALGVCSWGLAAWTLATPGDLDRFGTLKGTDFLQFHVAGGFVAANQPDRLYDWGAFASAVARTTPGVGETLYLSVYPPQVALLFAPFGALSYLPALALWTALSIALFVLSGAFLVRSLALPPADRPLAWLLALAAYPFSQVVLHGQIGTLVLLVLVLGWLAFRAGQVFWTGFALGSLCFKPQFAGVGLAAFVARPSWALAAGGAAGIAAQTLLVAVALGPSMLGQYLEAAGRVLESPGAFEPKVWQTHGLRGFWELLLGRGTLAMLAWGVSVVGVLVLVRRAVCATRVPALHYAAVILAGLLVNPHLYVYDLVVLLLPLGLVGAWSAGRRSAFAVRLGLLAYLLYWLPLVGPLARVTHFQLTAPAMLVLLAWLGKDGEGAAG